LSQQTFWHNFSIETKINIGKPHELMLWIVGIENVCVFGWIDIMLISVIQAH
jgi:hypothetical protein